MRKRVATGTPPGAVPAPANAAAGVWVEAGPATVVRGGALRNLRLAGCVRSLAVSADGQRVYAGGALGGLWFSGDGGGAWTPLDFAASVKDAAKKRWPADALTVGAVAVAFGAAVDQDLVVAGPGPRPAAAAWEQGASVCGMGLRTASGPAKSVLAQGAAAADPFTLEATDLAPLVVNALAVDPTAAGVAWAATSAGLHRRAPGAGNAPATWTRVDAGLGTHEYTGVAVVVVTPAGGGAAQRWIYAASGGQVARSPDGAAWTKVALPAQDGGARAAVAAGPVRLRAGNVPGKAVVWALADGPRLWRIEDAAAAVVAGVPDALRPAGIDGLPELALAVSADTDAAHQDLIALAGAGAYRPPGGGPPAAALFVGRVRQVAGTWTFPTTAVAGGPPAEWVGEGLPPGLRALAWVHPGGSALSQLWAAGDRGVFRSTADGLRGTFLERNTGLANAAPVSLGASPATEAALLAGTRGAGLWRRLSAEVWEVADAEAAGGVAVVESDVRLQYTHGAEGAWRSSVDGGRTWASAPLLSVNAAGAKAWDEARSAELKASPPVGRIAAISGEAARGVQLALGTDRVWYRDAVTAAAAGARSGWVTLPSATDPFDPALAAPDRAQDRLTQTVVALRWGSADRLYALTRAGAHLLARQADGTWKGTVLYDRAAVRLATKLKTPRGSIPADRELASLAVADATSGTGQLYVGTDASDDGEPLWWFDGQGAWHATGLGVDTAVHALAVDDDGTVYAGTDVGVYQGKLDTTGLAPKWTWTPWSTGLPQAPVVDLLLSRPVGGATAVLRAALAGRGVWEVALGNVQQGPMAFLRAHALDLRRDAVAPGGAREPIRLDASPDVRILRGPRTAPVDPVAFAGAAPYFGDDADPYDVWLVKGALLANGRDLDPLTAFDPRPAVRWSPADAGLLAGYAGALNPAPANARALWVAVTGPQGLTDPPSRPFDRAGDAADLAAWVVDEPDRFEKGRRPSTATGEASVVRVVVHARHPKPLDPARVSVALLRSQWVAAQGAGGEVGLRGLGGVDPLAAGWAAQLRADANTMRTWRGQPPGTPLPQLPGVAGWPYADGTQPIRAPLLPVDPMNPQVVEFTVDLSGGAFDLGWVLLAVVIAEDDLVVSAETDVATLVRTSRHVAARTVRRARAPLVAAPMTPGMDISQYPSRHVMLDAWRASNLVWTGLYLDAPLSLPGEIAPFQAPAGANPPPPGAFVLPAGMNLGPVRQGHNRSGQHPPPNDAYAWMRAWAEIHPDLGVLPIYFGAQDPNNGDVFPGNVWAPTGPFDLRPAIATGHGTDAADKAVAAGVPPGAAIYLDWEISGPPIADGLDYVEGLLRTLAARGYRPGLYGFATATNVLRLRLPGILIWNVRWEVNGVPPDAWAVSGGRLLVTTARALGDGNEPDPVARQHVFGDHLPNLGNANPVVADAGHGAFLPDLDVSAVNDPAFPERSPRGEQLRTGRAAAAVASGTAAAVYAIRRGMLARATWQPGQATPRVNVAGPAAGPAAAADPGVAVNPFVAPVALRGPTPAGGGLATDWVIAFGAEARGDPSAQRVVALRRQGAAPFAVDRVPDDGRVLDPLAGLAAFSRSPGALEVFAVDADTGRIASARHVPGRGWTALGSLGVGGAVVRTQGLAAVRRGDGATLCWVQGGALQGASSVRPEQWGAPAALSPGLDLHPLSRLAPASGGANRVDVFFVGATAGTNSWRLCVVTWRAAGGWSAPVQLDLGDAAFGIDPLCPIAACARDAAHVDAFAVGLDGALYRTTLDPVAGTFSALGATVAGPASGIASIDGAVCPAADRLQVLVTARGGKLPKKPVQGQVVFALQWSDPGGYSAFEQVAPLDPA